MNQGGEALDPAVPVRAPVPFRFALAQTTLAGRLPLLGLAVTTMLGALLPAVGLVAMQRLVDTIVAGTTGAVPAATASAGLLDAVALAAGTAGVGAVLRSRAAVAGERHGRRLADAHAARLQAHTARLDVAEFDRSAFHAELQLAGAAASQRPVRLVQDLLGLLAAVLGGLLMLILLAGVASWLGLVVGLAAVPLGLVRLRDGQVRAAFARSQVGVQREVAYLGGLFASRSQAKDVRLLDLHRGFGPRLTALRGRLRHAADRLANRRALAELGAHALATGALFGCYWWLGQQALAGGFGVGVLVLQIQAAQRTQNAVRDLVLAAAAVRENQHHLVPLRDLLARRPTLDGGAAPVPMPAAAVALSLQQVGFSYPDSNRAALFGIDLVIPPGERLLVGGANGSGKSTLLKLLARLYDPTTGTLHFGTTPGTAIPAAAVWGETAMLTQEASVLEGTVRELLAAGVPLADAALWSMLQVVALDTVVRQLPAGLDTPLSPRLPGGVELSAGQGRRLLLARTLLRPGWLILLDEPFAGLDAATVKGLVAHLRALPAARTLVLAEHHPAARELATRHLTLDGGRLVEAPAKF